MSQIVNGFINDLSAVRDNIKLRVRVLRTWMQPLFAKPNVSNLELIVMDEQASDTHYHYAFKFIQSNTLI